MTKDYNNELLNDCSWFAEKHRGKNKTSGAHWSTIIRFPKLYDEAVRLQKRVDTLEDYIADYCAPTISDKYKDIDACESALISMVQQYLYRPLDPTTNEPADNIYQHDFMSAGEEAFAYLVEHGLAEWTDDRYWAIRMKESEE